MTTLSKNSTVLWHHILHTIIQNKKKLEYFNFPSVFIQSKMWKLLSMQSKYDTASLGEVKTKVDFYNYSSLKKNLSSCRTTQP